MTREIPDFMADAVIMVECQECAIGSLVEDGWRQVHPVEPDPAGLVALDNTIISKGAQAHLHSSQQIWPWLTRHARGDWGLNGKLTETTVTPQELVAGCVATDNDAKLNRIAIETRGKGHGAFTSRFRLPGVKDELWIITRFDPAGSGGTITNIFMASEY
jgi:hypothetical protein